MNIRATFGVDKGFKVGLWFVNGEPCQTDKKLLAIAHDSCPKWVGGIKSIFIELEAGKMLQSNGDESQARFTPGYDNFD